MSNPPANDSPEVPQQQKVLLIDLENCPTQIKQLHNDLETFAHVIICYANNSPKIPLEWLTTFAGPVLEKRLNIVKMEQGGRNAADFGICFHAGVLMQRMPPDTHFVIISNDCDLDHTVRLLISQGRNAERVGNRKETPVHQTIPDNGADALAVYCAYLIAHSKNRPARRDTLLNSIKNKFKDSPAIAPTVFDALLKRSAITVTDGKVTYNDAKIQAFAMHRIS